MNEGEKLRLIQQVMGASHVFCSAVTELLERTLAMASEEQLAMSQVKLLLLIARPGQRFKVTDVADFLGVTNAAASRSIDRLVQRGLVERTVSADDRRAVDLALTAESEALLDEFTRARNAELLRLFGEHPAGKLRSATELLEELTVRLLDLESPGDEPRLRRDAHPPDGDVVRDVLARECAVSRALYGSGAHPDEAG